MTHHSLWRSRSHIYHILQHEDHAQLLGKHVHCIVHVIGVCSSDSCRASFYRPLGSEVEAAEALREGVPLETSPELVEETGLVSELAEETMEVEPAEDVDPAVSLLGTDEVLAIAVLLAEVAELVYVLPTYGAQTSGLCRALGSCVRYPRCTPSKYDLPESNCFSISLLRVQ